MAHFAEISPDGTVLRIIVVANASCIDANGQESEAVGAAFCQSLFGGMWKQASYSGAIRKNYPGEGYTYDAMRDAFIAPCPGEGWTLDEDTCQWNPPPDDPQP